MKLKEIHLRGFKSIDNSDGQHIALGDVTLLLGANGSGKSNLVSFFNMLGYMATGALQIFVGKYGVKQLLHFGPKTTESIFFKLTLEDDEKVDTYEVTLAHGLPDRLFVAGEKVTFHQRSRPKPQEYYLPTGAAEVSVFQDKENLTSKVLANLLRGIKTFQFHDTSDSARIKDRVPVDDGSYLRSDAGNLAAFLKMLKESEEHRPYYERIIRHIRMVMPQFGDFRLETLPNSPSFVRLNWTDSQGSDYLFGPDQISDGSLRFMALTTLLLQPPTLLPKVIVIDEPELGLHPAAIQELAGMIERASENAQIIAATQSTRLVDEFVPDQIMVVERSPATGSTQFKRLDQADLGEWLGRYSLSELWEKNVIGGQP